MSNLRKTVPIFKVQQPWYLWLPGALTALYLLIGVITFIFIPIQAIQWMKIPFMGAFVEHPLVLTGTCSPGWELCDQGIKFGYQMVKIEGQPVQDTDQLLKVLSQFTVGSQVDVMLRTPQGVLKDYPVKLARFTFQDALRYLLFPYAIGLVYLLSGIWVFVTGWQRPSGQEFTIFVTSIALATGGLFDLYTTHHLLYLWSLALPLAGAAILNLALRFPDDDLVIVGRRYWLSISYGIAAGLIMFTFFRLRNLAQPTSYAFAWQLNYLFVVASVVCAIFWFALRRFKRSIPREREQIRLILIGSILSFGLPSLWFLGSLVWRNLFPFTPYILLSLVIFPFSTGYAIQRYRLLQADFVLSRVLLYSLLALLITVGYAILITGLGLALQSVLAPGSPIVIGLSIFIMALLFNPLRRGLSKAMNAVFFRGQSAYQERLKTFSSELTRAIDLTGIIKISRDYANQSLIPTQIHIFIYDPILEQYIAFPDENGRLSSDLRISPNSNLVKVLNSGKSSLFLSDFDHLPPELQADQARIKLLGAQVYVPLPGRQRLSGWMALGMRLSGEPYTSNEISFIESLCDQSALAIERAQVLVNMENRVREMNVLSRIAQGINITLRLDDILELIYAQTTQIIPADDFHIILLDQELNNLTEIFHIENNERLVVDENKIVPAGSVLEQVVIFQHRRIITEDYSRECLQYQVKMTKPEIYAWMGVPLNAGAETIGSLSLGLRKPSLTYTPDQFVLFQAIADQAAGAIVKARLLQETERRARQMITLNELTRQLTSTLDVTSLLQNILQNAVDILGCEAGSLLLLDEQTDELVFQAVVSPVASDLINRRMPADSGVAGRSVKTRQPVIVNDVSKDTDWYAQTDDQTGYSTQALLVVPLVVKDRVIGAIEVLNKKDGSLFVRDDETLLSAFSAQAAVAIENARLYTLTDRALADRVEELSVMQRIDRELNTSLDTTRAMQITLDWAMRQSGANAGLVGMIVEDGVRVMASQGYIDELSPYKDASIPLSFSRMKRIIDAGIPQYFELPSEGDSRLLRSARSQTIIPIRRETATMGVVLLESVKTEGCSEETMSFLQRLTDHAAIAISNAQLYAAVQQANVAKSEFVSFVSHELKNPMTSIKGYTELLAKGAVGPVSDGQAGFLKTILSNVDRMSTLVSDLADVSRIEAGRLRLDFKAFVFSDVVEEVERSLRRQIEEKNQELIIQIPQDLPKVWADRNRVVQVFTNLVSNAYKYSLTNGKIHVFAEAARNTWDPDGPQQVVHVWVQDNGIGMSPEDQQKVFQKFFRSEDPKTREVPGTGLGLNITKSLVELQGGRIWFESEYRKGTTFHFTVPVAE